MSLKEIIKAKKHKKKVIIFALLGMVIYLFLIPELMGITTEKYIKKDCSKLPGTYTALVLGAQVYKSGNPSAILKDRLLKAMELYRKNIVKRFLLSGDHGSKYYDEVNNMKKFLLKNGVKGEDIFLDHAGFNTYSSIVRAKEVFVVTNLIIVTQEFHLPRAVYIARKKGMDAYGYIADRRQYTGMKYYKVREYFARIKSRFEVLFNVKPKYLGEEIPITGKSKLSWN